MDGVDATMFMRSQWHDATTAGTAIPPYGIAQVIGMSSITVNRMSRPANSVAVPTEDNPDRVVFTGPTGVPSEKSGICHAETMGYARYSGSLAMDKTYGVASGSTTLVEDEDGQFVPIGGTFASAAGNVALFYRKGVGSSRFCGIVRFEIVNIDVEDDPRSALVDIKGRPCGCLVVPDETESGQLTVVDALQCLLYDEDPEDYVGRAGFAAYMTFEVTPGVLDCRWEIFSLCCPETGAYAYL